MPIYPGVVGVEVSKIIGEVRGLGRLDKVVADRIIRRAVCVSSRKYLLGSEIFERGNIPVMGDEGRDVTPFSRPEVKAISASVVEV